MRPRNGGQVERRRRRSERVIAAVVLPLSMTLLCCYLILFAPEDSIGDRCAGITLLYGGVAVACVIGIGPRLDMDDEGLRVVNWLWTYRIPWLALRDVRVTHCLVLETIDRTVKPAIGSGSGADRARRFRLQHDLADEILAAKTQRSSRASQSEGEERVIRRWNPVVGVVAAVYLALLIFAVTAY